jgi:hypothetical protein
MQTPTTTTPSPITAASHTSSRSVPPHGAGTEPARAQAASLVQSISTFVITLHAPPDQVLPFFGPVREAEWTDDWAPTFLYPAAGAQTEGTVFATYDADRGHAVWVLTDLDEAAGRVGYVLVSPGFVLMEIKIRIVAAIDPDRGGVMPQSRVTVMYRRTALAAAANAFVSGFTHEWEAQQHEFWQREINAAVDRSRTTTTTR